VSIVLFEPE